MKKLGIRGLVIAWGVGIQGCGAPAEVFSYDFTVNGCKTGKHEFDTLKAYCDALKDDDLNQGCATSFREIEFDSRCK